MMRVTVKGLHVTLVDDDGAVFEFDCSLEESSNNFSAALVRIPGHADKVYYLPFVVGETYPGRDCGKALDLEHSRNRSAKWFKEMMEKLIVESLK